MSLETGKRIHAYHWEDAFPIPDSLIEIAEELVSGENMPLIQNKSTMFEWSPCVPIYEEDLTYQ